METTAGPPGQGIATAVGMAPAERMLNARFGDGLVDHHTCVIAGDGCLMEGVSHEAIDFAGHIGLGRLSFDRSIKISPSIHSADFAYFGREIRAIEAQGADMITAHVEAGPHIHRTLQAIRAAGCKAGVSLNPGTPLEAVEHVLDICDMVLIMTVNPGFGGQKFIPRGVEKTRRLRAMIGDRPIHIQIDGGVTPETAPLVAAADVLVAGSAVFKGGSVDNPAPYGTNIRAIRDAAEGARAAA